jgi:hypothetical protein
MVQIVEMVPRDFTFHQVNHVLGDICRAVSDPLDMPANGKEM